MIKRVCQISGRMNSISSISLVSQCSHKEGIIVFSIQSLIWLSSSYIASIEISQTWHIQECHSYLGWHTLLAVLTGWRINNVLKLANSASVQQDPCAIHVWFWYKYDLLENKERGHIWQRLPLWVTPDWQLGSFWYVHIVTDVCMTCRVIKATWA